MECERQEFAIQRTIRTLEKRAALIGKLKAAEFKRCNRRDGEQDQLRIARHLRDSGEEVVLGLKKARAAITWEKDGRQACDALDALIFATGRKASAESEVFYKGAQGQRAQLLQAEAEIAALRRQLAEKRYFDSAVTATAAAAAE